MAKPKPQKSSPSSLESAKVMDLLNELLESQLTFRRKLQQGLDVDPHGLDAMIYLATRVNASPTKLSEHLDISTAATSLVLQRLESAKHVARKKDPKDGRKVVVTPAKKSVEEAFRIAAPVMKGTRTLLQNMSSDEIAVLAKFLDQLVKIYSEDNLNL